MYPKNAASPEPIAIGAVVQISDGAVQTSGCTVRIKPIGVAEGDGGGTTSYSTDGIVYYTPTQAETNYTSFILIAKKTGCIPVAVTIITTSSATPGTVLLAPVTHTSAVIPTVTTLTNLPAITSNWLTAAGLAADAVTEIQSGLALASDLATVAGYLDTEIAAILADTNELQTDWADGGRLDLILDARASQTSVDDVPTNAELTSALGTGTWATAIPWNASWDAEVESEVTDALNAYDPPTNAEMIARTLATADYATATDLATLTTYVDTEVSAIKAKTDNLPSDPADASDIAASFSTVNGTLSTIAGYIDTEISALTSAVADVPTNAELTAALAAADDAVLAAIAALNNLSAAQVNAEVLDVVGTDLLVAGVTIKEALRRQGAILSGKVTNAGTGAETFKDYAESASTIVITVDSSGNRSAITYN